MARTAAVHNGVGKCPYCEKRFRVASKYEGYRVKCLGCGKQFVIPGDEPEGKPPKLPASNASIYVSTITGVAGSIALMVGAFAPIISAPLFGSINYFQNGKGDGVLVLIFAALSLGLIASQKFKWLWATGIASGLCVGYALLNVIQRIDTLAAEAETQAEIMVAEQVQMQWGWAALIGGSLLLLVAASTKRI